MTAICMAIMCASAAITNSWCITGFQRVLENLEFQYCKCPGN